MANRKSTRMHGIDSDDLDTRSAGISKARNTQGRTVFQNLKEAEEALRIIEGRTRRMLGRITGTNESEKKEQLYSNSISSLAARVASRTERIQETCVQISDALGWPKNEVVQAGVETAPGHDES